MYAMCENPPVFQWFFIEGVDESFSVWLSAAHLVANCVFDWFREDNCGFEGGPGAQQLALKGGWPNVVCLVLAL